jgi:hypothetical protein
MTNLVHKVDPLTEKDRQSVLVKVQALVTW